MAKVSIKKHFTGDAGKTYVYTRAWFKCPGCGQYHGYTIELGPGETGPVWTFNGDVDSPTFGPSYRTWTGPEGSPPDWQCHFFVENGMIRFCGDCIDNHQPAKWNGQVMELQELDPDSWLSKED